LNETANYAHVFLPGSTFLEKDGTFTNAERRIQRVRKVMTPRNGLADWEVTIGLARAMAFDMNYNHPSEIMDEIAALTPTFAGVSYSRLDELPYPGSGGLGGGNGPGRERGRGGPRGITTGASPGGKGMSVAPKYAPPDDPPAPPYPLLQPPAPPPSHYNAGPQPRRTENV